MTTRPGRFITQTYQRAEAFLFGWRTYELFAGSWGSIDQLRAHPAGVALNEAPQVRCLDHAHRAALGGHDRSPR